LLICVPKVLIGNVLLLIIYKDARKWKKWVEDIKCGHCAKNESYTCGQWCQWNEMMWERLWNEPWFNYSELTSKIELPKSLWTQVMPICGCFNKCYALWVFSMCFAFLHIREWKLCIALFGEKYFKNKWCVTCLWF